LWESEDELDTSIAPNDCHSRHVSYLIGDSFSQVHANIW